MGVYRFVFASSCSVYGVTDEEVDEGSPLNPVSLYAKTKIDSERELLANVRDGFYVTVLRFATVFGHSSRPRFDLVANLFSAQAMTDGLITVIGPNQWRPFVHVRDLARSIVAVVGAEPETVQNQRFNVGDSRLNMTILQLAEEVKRVASKHRDVKITVTENPEDKRNYSVSFDKIKRVLGFECETLMQEGIEEMVNHFAEGHYGDYKRPLYSNVATTAENVEAFHDPEQVAHLYAPLTDHNE
jgi:nucleoside-diphosphate-sugar epimerase